MKLFQTFAVVGFISLLSACASGPTPEQISNADYGQYMSSAECVEVAEQKIRSVLKDPNSAMFTHQSCYKGYGQNVPILSLPVEFGYIQSGTVNAKNSFGGYTGSKPYNVLIRNGRAIRYCIADGEYGACIPSR